MKRTLPIQPAAQAMAYAALALLPEYTTVDAVRIGSLSVNEFTFTGDTSATVRLPYDFGWDHPEEARGQLLADAVREEYPIAKAAIPQAPEAEAAPAPTPRKSRKTAKED